MLRQIAGRAAGLGLMVLTALPAAARADEVPDFKASAHRVAIISLLGDELNFGAESRRAVPGAGFDTLAEDAMVQQIAADLPGAVVTKIDLPRGELLAQMYPASGFGDVGMNNIRQALRQWAAEHGQDYIVVFRKTGGDPFPTVPDKTGFFGIGLANKNAAATPNKLVPAALLNVTILDGTTLTTVADLSARDTDWGSIDYVRGKPEAQWLPRLVDDAKAMLTSMAPALVHGTGM